jgi:hypothetical protein
VQTIHHSFLYESLFFLRYPPQDQVGGGAKIPSILWYDEYGKVCAVGAEAEQQSVIQMAEDFEWHKVEW